MGGGPVTSVLIGPGRTSTPHEPGPGRLVPCNPGSDARGTFELPAADPSLQPAGACRYSRLGTPQAPRHCDPSGGRAGPGPGRRPDPSSAAVAGRSPRAGDPARRG